MRLVREDVAGVTGSTGAPAAGEMRERVRLFDWAATPLGPRERWSASLEWAVELILSSGFPMGVRWGPEFTMIYNDACASLIGDKHPGALGRSLAESWPEINEQLGPICAAILRGERPGFFAEDHPWSLRRHGVLEESRFTISYSPIPDPTAKSGIGGILITSFETTERVRNERVLRVLTSQLEAEVQQRTRERDRIWQVSEDLLGVSNFDGYFVSINPAWTRLLGWSEEEIKAHACAHAAPSRRCTAFGSRPRAPGAGRADRAHGKPLPPPRRQLALDLLDHDRRRRAHLRRRPPRHRREEGGRSVAQQRAAIPRADRRRHRLRFHHARSHRHRGELEYRGPAHQGLYRRGDHRPSFLAVLYRGGPRRRPATTLDRHRHGNRQVRGGSLAHAQGRLALLRQCGDRCRPRRERQADRFRQDHPRRHRAAQCAGDA